MLRIACFCLPLFLLPANPAEIRKDDFSIKRAGSVSEELSEISGWVFVNDSTLIAHNDGGNAPLLYVLNLDGTIRHTARIDNVKNIDFEDIATDGKGFLYLADIGNNENKRTDLAIHKIRTAGVLSDSVVNASTIFLSYAGQTAFPPQAKQLYFDSEALTYYNDSLWIFTKCRTRPFDGKSMIYSVPTTPGTYSLTSRSFIETGKKTWLLDGITAAEMHNDDLFLLTYNRLMICSFKGGKAVLKTTIPMAPISQKESVAVRKDGTIYVVDERQKLIGGGHIFVVTQNNR